MIRPFRAAGEPLPNKPTTWSTVATVLSLGRRYRSRPDRLRSLDEKWLVWRLTRCWLGNVDASKFDVAAAAHAVLMDSENLFLAVFRRRTETVADISIKAIHALMLLDRGLDEEARDLARRALDRAYHCKGRRHGLLGGRGRPFYLQLATIPSRYSDSSSDLCTKI